jgi:hypothetical protein
VRSRTARPSLGEDFGRDIRGSFDALFGE